MPTIATSTTVPVIQGIRISSTVKAGGLYTNHAEGIVGLGR